MIKRSENKIVQCAGSASKVRLVWSETVYNGHIKDKLTHSPEADTEQIITVRITVRQ